MIANCISGSIVLIKNILYGGDGRGLLSGQELSLFPDKLKMKHSEGMHQKAKDLRKNMTAEERHLWYDFLSKTDYKARRQKMFFSYILDFYIPEVKIAIELDGRQHGKPENKEQDQIRDAFLSQNGILVLRYTNEQINENFQNVCRDIQKHYNERKE